MNVQVTYDDSDVAKALESIIEDPNWKEFVNLLTPLLCQNSQATTWFFKLMLGNKLPEIIPNGTLCKMLVKDLDYNANKNALMNTHLIDNECKVIVRVKEFRGWHENYNYIVRYTNIHNDHGGEYEESSYAQVESLEVIEEL